MYNLEDVKNLEKMVHDLPALERILHESLIMLEAIEEYGESEQRMIEELCKNLQDFRVNTVYFLKLMNKQFEDQVLGGYEIERVNKFLKKKK